MEVQAVLEALRELTGDITIVSDSTYVVNCFRDRWWAKWERNGWRNSQKQPVANTDLWIGNRMNDLVDQLAVAAAKGPFGVDSVESTDAGGPLTLF